MGSRFCLLDFFQLHKNSFSQKSVNKENTLVYVISGRNESNPAYISNRIVFNQSILLFYIFSKTVGFCYMQFDISCHLGPVIQCVPSPSFPHTPHILLFGGSLNGYPFFTCCRKLTACRIQRNHNIQFYRENTKQGESSLW